ncbi:TlpA disulfide reductase family protein [Bremerella cremea]
MMFGLSPLLRVLLTGWIIAFSSVGLSAEPAADQPAAEEPSPVEAVLIKARQAAQPRTGDDLLEAAKLIDQVWDLQPTPEEEIKAMKTKARYLYQAGVAGNQGARFDAKNFLDQKSHSKVPQVALAARSSLLEYQLQEIITLPNREKQFYFDQAEACVLENPPSTATGDLAFLLIDSVHGVHGPVVAGKLASKIAKHFAGIQTKPLATYSQFLAGMANQLALVDTPIEIKATRLDGTPLDVAQDLQGKIVLIDFWATWCGPCIREFPEMKRLYEIYHPHGLEIVSISLDDTQEPVTQFVNERELPWTFVWDAPPEGMPGWFNPNAMRYGVRGIPAMFLLGKDGKAIALSARGRRLTKLLKEVFPDVEVPAEKPADETP